MSAPWTGWNDGAAPRTCHCSDCDAPLGPSCNVCRGDGVDIDEFGHCPECRPTDEETCEEWTARTRARRAK